MSCEALAALVMGRKVLALTGAGCSTESGIPDYRGAGARPTKPVEYQAFRKDPRARQRYWARSVAGWERFSSAKPNACHFALAELEQRGQLAGLVTQNVDGLHRAAGSRDVVELHGALARVRCLDCGAEETRAALQQRMLEANPGWSVPRAAPLPDGDVELDTAGFSVVGCLACGGALKPDVVFFGENVPRATVEEVYARVEAADVLLVVGSSLAVFSGYRFVRRAAERGQPVAIVNLGPTRGDALATLRWEARAGEALPALVERLAPLTRGPSRSMPPPSP